MTLYEKKLYEADIPRAIKALERIADALEIIVSDPGDEVEHITKPARQYNLPDDYGPIKMD